MDWYKGHGNTRKCCPSILLRPRRTTTSPEYTTTKDHDTAMDWYKKAMAIREKVLPEHPSTATTYNDIATTCYNQGDYGTALDWNKRPWRYARKCWADHPSTATTYNNLAAIYYKQGDYTKALGWYKRPWRYARKCWARPSFYGHDIQQHRHGILQECIRRRWTGIKGHGNTRESAAEHPSTATTYTNIARIYYNRGDYDTALDRYKSLGDFENVTIQIRPRYTTISPLYMAVRANTKRHWNGMGRLNRAKRSSWMSNNNVTPRLG